MPHHSHETALAVSDADTGCKPFAYPLEIYTYESGIRHIWDRVQPGLLPART
jgi:hypothetical protein